MAAKNKRVAKSQTEAPQAPDVDTLASAMQRAFEMAPDDALSVAGIVVEHFAGVAEVNDDTIDAELRSLFYTLEAKRILSFRREEYDNEAGEKRRAFWWRIRAEVVAELSAPATLPRDEDVYAQLPAECWRREAAA
ncbi:MAG TPA: hypothetical protein VGR28_04775 [Candidatus Thermoplasmatota archaeon]|jgi:hypothetical protein|nr:hypothetical protein [Candidatus Thermoplasmatota archaeon]